jgi:hypothetical protein
MQASIASANRLLTHTHLYWLGLTCTGAGAIWPSNDQAFCFLKAPIGHQRTQRSRASTQFLARMARHKAFNRTLRSSSLHALHMLRGEWLIGRDA